MKTLVERYKSMEFDDRFKLMEDCICDWIDKTGRTLFVYGKNKQPQCIVNGKYVNVLSIQFGDDGNIVSVNVKIKDTDETFSCKFGDMIYFDENNVISNLLWNMYPTEMSGETEKAETYIVHSCSYCDRELEQNIIAVVTTKKEAIEIAKKEYDECRQSMIDTYGEDGISSTIIGEDYYEIRELDDEEIWEINITKIPNEK